MSHTTPNSFISPDDASVHLDTLHVLGKALIKVKEWYGDTQLVLFKTDVLQAYRCLPVHPLWQLWQVVMICDIYHVDNDNNFGNWGASWLWVTVFGLVLWIAIIIVHILVLFAYIDDAFSWIFTDNLTYYPLYSKLLPTKQAKLLTLRRHWNSPWGAQTGVQRPSSNHWVWCWSQLHDDNYADCCSRWVSFSYLNIC